MISNPARTCVRSHVDAKPKKSYQLRDGDVQERTAGVINPHEFLNKNIVEGPRDDPGKTDHTCDIGTSFGYPYYFYPINAPQYTHMRSCLSSAFSTCINE